MSSSVLPLPANYKFGRVVCRVLQGISDTPADSDHLPEALPGSGTIIFTPASSTIRDFGKSPAFVGHGTYKYVLHSESGELVDDQTLNVPSELEDLGDGEFARLVPGAGIWLFEGVWNVKFNLGSISVPSFPIEVVAANHTASTPMDLVTEAPFVPQPASPTTTMELPLGRVHGRVLGISESGQVAWIAPTGTGGSADWNSLAGRPAVVAAGNTTSEARLSIGAVPDTDPRLSDTRDPKPHAHSISDTTGLQDALNAKQASGSYATGAQGAKADSAVQPADLPTWGTLGEKPATFPPTIGATATTAVAGDDARLGNARVPTAHTHAVSEVTGLQAALDGKANSAPSAPGTFWGVRTAAEWAALGAPTGTGPWWGVST